MKKETNRNETKRNKIRALSLSAPSIPFDGPPQYSFTFWPSTKFDEIHAFIEFLMIYISVSQKFKFGNFFARSDGFAFIRIDDTFFLPEPERHRHVQMETFPSIREAHTQFAD